MKILGLLLGIGILLSGGKAEVKQQQVNNSEFKIRFEEVQPNKNETTLEKHYKIYKENKENNKPSKAEFEKTFEEIQGNLLKNN